MNISNREGGSDQDRLQVEVVTHVTLMTLVTLVTR